MELTALLRLLCSKVKAGGAGTRGAGLQSPEKQTRTNHKKPKSSFKVTWEEKHRETTEEAGVRTGESGAKGLEVFNRGAKLLKEKEGVHCKHHECTVGEYP